MIILQKLLSLTVIIYISILSITGLSYAQDSYAVVSAEAAASAGGYTSVTAAATTTNAAANSETKKDKAVSTTTKTTEASAATITELEATDQDGNKITVKLTDVAGLTSEWLNKIGYDKTKSKVTVELDADGKVKTLTVSDSAGTNICEYQTSTHLMKFFHTEGDLKGKADYVTSESTRQYTWRYSGYDRTDPGMGKDGHVITQKYNYDTDGKVKSVEYFTWTAGNRKKTDDKQKYSRYMYRVDTYKDGVLDKTTYNNDPRPTFWEPTITGKVITSDDGKEYLFKTTDGKIYKFTAMKDGFDADGDGVSGAEEMSKVDWAAYADKDITISLRGQEIAAENESDYYSEGKKIEGFGVSDVIQTDKGEKIKEGWDEIADKVSTALSKVFVIMGDEKDINKVYDKVYTKLEVELKKAGVTADDITSFADADMQKEWGITNGTFVMPKISAPSSSDVNGNVKFTFSDGTLKPADVSDLGANITVDGKTEYWMLTPSMISADGKTISMKLDAKYDEKTMQFQFIAKDSTGKLTANSNTVSVLIDSNLSSLTIPSISAASSSDVNGNVKFTFSNGTLKSSDISDLGVNVTVDGKTEYWELKPSMISTDGKTLTMQFGPEYDEKTMQFQFVAKDTSGKLTTNSNKVSVLIDSSPSSIIMPNINAPSSSDANGNVKFTFTNGTLKPADIAKLGVKITVDGQVDYWELDTSIINGDAKSLLMKLEEKYEGKTLKFAFYAIDKFGKRTNLTNEISVLIDY